MDTKELLKILRNIHYKCFFIGIIFFIIAALVYMPCKCFIADVYQSVFGIGEEVYYNMWAGFLGLIKTILIFFFLVPGLAIHWTELAYKNKSE